MSGAKAARLPAERRDRGFRAALGRIEGLPIIVVFLVLVGAFVYLAPEVFLRWPIYFSFLTTIPPMLVLSLGLTLVISAGEIDLSFPSVLAFSGFLFAWTVRHLGLDWLGAALALGGGALVGLVNGYLIAVVGIPSIIVTIGTQFFWGGIAVVLSGGLSYSLQRLGPTALNAIFTGTLGGGIPMQALWAVALCVFVWFLLNRHRFGEHLLFIGDNREVARVAGINVRREVIKVFTLMGTLAGFAAVLLTMENRNFFSTQGQGYLLPALAAVFIGGTSVFGGSGKVIGTFFGAYIIGMLDAGIVATGVAGFWVQVIVGVVFVTAVVFHLLMENPGRLTTIARVFRRRSH